MGDYTRLLRRRWRYPVLIIPATLLLAVLIAFLLPVQYRAAGTIMLEPASLPQTMVQSTVVQQADFRDHASQQLELVRRTVLSPERLKTLVQAYDPYPQLKDVGIDAKAAMVAADASTETVDPITYQASDRSSAFSIYYLNENPKRAAVVTTKLVNLFLAYNQESRAEQAKQALQFLQEQAHALEKTMQTMEVKLAQFKVKYGDALPNAENRNLTGVDRVTREVEGLQREILGQEQQESLLQLQLNDISPTMVGAVSDWRAELAKAKADLADAQQKYTPEHPDVKRLRRVIADLQAKGGGAAQGNVQPDNPEYLRVQSQLTGVRRQLAILRSNSARANANLSTYERNLVVSPNVEREYTQLTRDYGNAQNSYQDLQNKIKAAALSQSLESEARGERFALMKAPTVPSKPFAPNRLGILALGLMLGAVVSIGLAIIVDASDHTVRGVDDLQDVMEVVPIGVVPKILSQADLRQRRIRWATVGVAYSAAAFLVAAAVFLNR